MHAAVQPERSGLRHVVGRARQASPCPPVYRDHPRTAADPGHTLVTIMIPAHSPYDACPEPIPNSSLTVDLASNPGTSNGYRIHDLQRVWPGGAPGSYRLMAMASPGEGP